MSRDVLLVDKSGECKGTVWSLENLATGNWLKGHAPGAEAAAAFLTDRSAHLFLKGDTELAIIFRDAAKEIMAKVVPDLKRKAEKHAEDYPETVEDDDA